MSRLSGALILLLALAGCAATEDRRFPERTGLRELAAEEFDEADFLSTRTP